MFRHIQEVAGLPAHEDTLSLYAYLKKQNIHVSNKMFVDDALSARCEAASTEFPVPISITGWTNGSRFFYETTLTKL